MSRSAVRLRSSGRKVGPKGVSRKTRRMVKSIQHDRGGQAKTERLPSKTWDCRKLSSGGPGFANFGSNAAATGPSAGDIWRTAANTRRVEPAQISALRGCCGMERNTPPLTLNHLVQVRILVRQPRLAPFYGAFALQALRWAFLDPPRPTRGDPAAGPCGCRASYWLEASCKATMVREKVVPPRL